MAKRFVDLPPEEQDEARKRYMCSEILKGAVILGLGLLCAAGVVILGMMLPDHLAVFEPAASVVAGIILLLTGVASMRHLLPILRWVVMDSAARHEDDYARKIEERDDYYRHLDDKDPHDDDK